MEEKIEKLLKMMEELQEIEKNERIESLHKRNSRLANNENKRNENLTKIEELENSRSIIVENNVRLENMRASFSEGEEQYTELTAEIDANNVEIARIDSEIEDLNNGIEALHNEDKEIRDEALIIPKPEKRAEMEALKQEIISDLTNIQRDIVSNRNVPTQEVKDIEEQNAQLKAQVGSRNEEIKQKEAEVEKLKEEDKEEIARLEAENEKITQKIELAEQFAEEKEKIDVEQEMLLKDIEESKRGIEIEKKAVARSGYTGKLEVQERWLKEKEEQFAGNEKSIDNMRVKLHLKDIKGIHRFIQRNKNKFAKNLATIKANKPNEKIGVLNEEISSMRAENKKVEQRIEENSSKADAIKTYIHDYSEEGYSLITNIPALIEAVKGIDTTFEYDTVLDMDKINSIKASIHDVEINSECLKSNRKAIHKDNDSLSQEDVDKIIAKAKIQRVSEAKTGAKARFNEYLKSKGVEKEKVITIYGIMNKYINNETDVVRIETLSDFDEFIKGRMERIATRIEELKQKEAVEVIETKRIAFLEKTLKEMKEECEVLGIEKIQEKPDVDVKPKTDEPKDNSQQQTQTTASNNQTEPKPESHEETSTSVEESEKEEKSIDKIIIGDGIEVWMYDNEARMHTARKISFRKMNGILKLREKDKIAMINEMIGEVVNDDIKSMLKDMDPNVIYSLSTCVRKYGISKAEAGRNLEMYIDALNGIEEAKNYMSEVLEYNKTNKLFAKKVCDNISGFADKAKQLGIAKVKEAKSGILSRIFKKKAIAEATVTEQAHEEPSFAQRMADEDATRRTNEVSVKAAEEQGIQEAEQQSEQEGIDL